MSGKVFVRNYAGRLREWWSKIDISREEYDFFDIEYLRDIENKLRDLSEEQEVLDRMLEKARTMLTIEDENYESRR